MNDPIVAFPMILAWAAPVFGVMFMASTAPPGYSHDGSRQNTAEIKRDYVRDNPNMAGQAGLPDVALSDAALPEAAE